MIEPAKTKSASASISAPPVAEHYDALLRGLQAGDNESAGRMPRAIGITSCCEREGVTTVAVNLAVAAAQTSVGPILLVDANVRRPNVHKVFGVQGKEEGLVDAVLGKAGVFDCILESPVENLSLMLAGHSTNGREPVYEGSLVDELLDSIKHVFPLIVLDLPPATNMTSCLSIAGRLDGVILVIEADRVDQAVAQRAKSQLLKTDAKILGVVFNKQY